MVVPIETAGEDLDRQTAEETQRKGGDSAEQLMLSQVGNSVLDQDQAMLGQVAQAHGDANDSNVQTEGLDDITANGELAGAGASVLRNA